MKAKIIVLVLQVYLGIALCQSRPSRRHDWKTSRGQGRGKLEFKKNFSRIKAYNKTFDFMSTTRRCTHAGSWYNKDETALHYQLQAWINDVKKDNAATHAGYSYSGRTAAYSYQFISQFSWKRAVLFGPSHHFALNKGIACCCDVDAIETPLGSIQIAVKYEPIVEKALDEAEHSLEMQYPFLKLLGIPEVVPFLVGELEDTMLEDTTMLEELRSLLADPETLLVISSDFCHYGARFRFTPDFPGEGTPSDGIQSMDLAAMDAIRSNNPELFQNYLTRTHNTICGRGPILLAMSILGDGEWKLLHYEQSNQVTDKNCSSVSYIAAVFLSSQPQ